MIASLPMYDFEQIQSAHDELWRFIASHMRTHGVESVPGQLTRGKPLKEVWTDPMLLLGQTCGYPLVKGLTGSARVIAAPVYNFPGCESTNHCSFIIVPHTSKANSLSDLRGCRCVINSEDSNTGMNLLRASIAELDFEAPFFSEVRAVGAHASSIAEVANNRADVAAVDCITYAYISRFNPELVVKTRIIGKTALTPSLPIITSAEQSEETVNALRHALDAVADSPELRETREVLGLVGFSQAKASDYDKVREFEKFAIDRGYSNLV